MDLPPSAAEILRSTYSSITHHLKLNHKQRRKLWKKQKRRKKRIINFFAEHAMQESTSERTESSDEDATNSNLPVGSLTNNAIICHLKSLQLTTNSLETKIKKGILKKHEDNTLPLLPDSHPPKCSFEQNNAEGNRETLQQNSATSTDALNETAPEDQPRNATEQNASGEDSGRPNEENKEVQNLLDLLDEEVERWQNPPAPPDFEEPEVIENPLLHSKSILPEEKAADNRPVCNFYAKTGACRFGNACSRKHEDVEISDTLLFPKMFQPFMFEIEDKSKVNGDAHDLSLEHSEEDLYEEYLDFYSDIEPEFQAIGKVRHLYVCGNRVRHLRGSVYVQYDTVDSAKKCYNKMLGRYYNGKPLYSKFIAIPSWNESICGLHSRQKSCPRGGQCNFLHTFKRKPHFVRHKIRKFGDEYARQRHHCHRNRWISHEYRSHRRSWSRRRSSSSDEGSRFISRKRNHDTDSHERKSSRSQSRSSSSSPSHRKRKHRRSNHSRSSRTSSHGKKSGSRSKLRNTSTAWAAEKERSHPKLENQSTFQSFSLMDISENQTELSRFDSSLNTKSNGVVLNRESSSLHTVNAATFSVDSKASKRLKKLKKKHKKRKNKHKRAGTEESEIDND